MTPELFPPVTISNVWGRSSGVSFTGRYKAHKLSVNFDNETHVKYSCMTAIAAVYTPEGFVIGADGLRREGNSTVVVNDKAIKIFRIAHKDVVGAYGWTGATSLLYSNMPPFHFLDRAEQIAEELQQIRFYSFPAYAQMFSECLRDSLILHHLGFPVLDGQPEEIVRGLFIGYAAEEPFRVIVSLRHKNGVVLPLQLDEVYKVPEGFRILSGSSEVWKKLQDTFSPPMTLSEGISQMKGYISTCIDNQTTDPACADIGGHIHIGTVTAKNGFEWAIPPEIT